MNEKESLERSHSKASNFKLTLVCLIALLSFAMLFISLALYLAFDKGMVYLVMTIISAVLTVLSFISFYLFKR